jgi:TolB-like protein
MAWALLLLLPLAGASDGACARFRVVDSIAASVGTACEGPAVATGDTIKLEAGGLVVLQDREQARETVCVHRGRKAVTLVVDDKVGLKPKPCRSSACRKVGALSSCTVGEVVPPVTPAGHHVTPPAAAPPTTAPSPAPPTATVAPEARGNAEEKEAGTHQVLVTAFAGTDVPAGTAQILTTLTAVELDRREGFEVVTGEELKALIAQAGTASVNNCSDEAGECLAEVAGALGARFLVSGRVAKAGRLLVVSVSLFDTDAAKAIGRAQFEAQDVVAARERLPLAVDNLLAAFLGTAPVTIPPPPIVRAAEDSASIWGAVMTGAGTAAGSVLCFALPSGACMSASILGGGVLASAFLLPAIPCTACACFPTMLGSAVGDMVFGFDVGWWRALAAGITAAAVLGVTAFITAVLVGILTLAGPIGGALISGGAIDPSDPLLILPALIAAPVALLIGVLAGSATAVAASALVFDLGVVVFEPTPDPLAEPTPEELGRAWPGEQGPARVRLAAQAY